MAFLIALTLALVAPAAATADFGVAAFDTAAVDQLGNPSVQAGAPPHAVITAFSMKQVLTGNGSSVPDGDYLKDVVVDLPVGLVGDPTAIPACRAATFLLARCPPATQVGTAVAEAAGGVVGLPAPVYNLQPAPGVAAQFAFIASGAVPVIVEARIRPDDYGVRIAVRGLAQAHVIAVGAELALWGVPADPSHDQQRCIRLVPPVGCIGTPGTPFGPNPAGVVPEPLLTNPTSCTPAGAGLETRLQVHSYSGLSASASVVSHRAPHYSFFDAGGNPLPASERPLSEHWGAAQGLVDCESLRFAPSVSVKPDTNQPDSPTGLDVSVSFSQ